MSKWGSWNLWKQRAFRACCHLLVKGPVCWHLSGSYRSLHTWRILDDLRMAACPQARIGDKGYRITGHHPLSHSLCGGTTGFWWRHLLSSVCLGTGQGGWGFDGCRCIFQEKKKNNLLVTWKPKFEKELWQANSAVLYFYKIKFKETYKSYFQQEEYV